MTKISLNVLNNKCIKKIIIFISLLVIVVLFLLKIYSNNAKKPLIFPTGSVVVQPSGGLGNQFFQYAAAYTLAKKTNSRLYVLVDEVAEEKGMLNPQDRNFTLTKFNIPTEEIIYTHQINKEFLDQHNQIAFFGSSDHPLKKHMEEFFNIIYVDESNFFDLVNVKNQQILFINDYFESEIFFKEMRSDIVTIFSFNDYYKRYFILQKHLHSVISKVSEENSFCVHVRRGDMLNDNNKLHLLPIDYQKLAIKLAKTIVKAPKFYIFSDSIKITKDELRDIADLNYINYTPLEDFEIMRNCGNIIIAGSTFSWWAAYLNKNQSKVVIAPNPRYTENLIKSHEPTKKRREKRKLFYYHAYPENWIQLEYNPFNLIEYSNHYVSDQTEKKELLNNFNPKKFSIYSGNMIELEICKTGNFYSNICTLKKPIIITNSQ